MQLAQRTQYEAPEKIIRDTRLFLLGRYLVSGYLRPATVQPQTATATRKSHPNKLLAEKERDEQWQF